jgi:hypothetical protein
MIFEHAAFWKQAIACVASIAFLIIGASVGGNCGAWIGLIIGFVLIQAVRVLFRANEEVRDDNRP